MQCVAVDFIVTMKSHHWHTNLKNLSANWTQRETHERRGDKVTVRKRQKGGRGKGGGQTHDEMALQSPASKVELKSHTQF